MIPVFKWRVERNVDIDNKYRVIETQFGDGYRQVAADGINNEETSYKIRVNAKTKQAKEIMEFFRKLGGYNSFLWTPPLGEQGLFRTTDPKPTYQGGDLYVITATFQRAYGFKE